MSGSGTDKTKSGIALTGPVVILVEPQLGENIGMAARAMGNFALSRLRIVNPRDGWPNLSAQRAAAGHPAAGGPGPGPGAGPSRSQSEYRSTHWQAQVNFNLRMSVWHRA